MQTERSGKQYTHLSAEKRAVLMEMLDEKHGLRGIAARLGQAPSTPSRELARTLGTGERRWGARAPVQGSVQPHERATAGQPRIKLQDKPDFVDYAYHHPKRCAVKRGSNDEETYRDATRKCR